MYFKFQARDLQLDECLLTPISLVNHLSRVLYSDFT